PIFCFDKTNLLQLKHKLDTRKHYWIPLDETCLRWSRIPQLQIVELAFLCMSAQDVNGFQEIYNSKFEVKAADDNGDFGSCNTYALDVSPTESMFLFLSN
ncbi:unnamed protein product, partial [Dicrocoelium dendriticum]